MRRQSWKHFAGRQDGDEKYKFGDLGRGLFDKVGKRLWKSTDAKDPFVKQTAAELSLARKGLEQLQQSLSRIGFPNDEIKKVQFRDQFCSIQSAMEHIRVGLEELQSMLQSEPERVLQKQTCVAAKQKEWSVGQLIIRTDGLVFQSSSEPYWSIGPVNWRDIERLERYQNGELLLSINGEDGPHILSGVSDVRLLERYASLRHKLEQSCDVSGSLSVGRDNNLQSLQSWLTLTGSPREETSIHNFQEPWLQPQEQQDNKAEDSPVTRSLKQTPLAHFMDFDEAGDLHWLKLDSGNVQKLGHVKLLAADLDKTLYPNGMGNATTDPKPEARHEFDKNIEGFMHFMENGGLAIPVTGNSPAMAQQKFDRSQVKWNVEEHPGVFCNGALVLGVGGVVEYSAPIPMIVMKQLQDWATESNGFFEFEGTKYPFAVNCLTKSRVLYCPPKEPNAASRLIAEGWARMQLMTSEDVHAGFDWAEFPAYQVNLLLKSRGDLLKEHPALEEDAATKINYIQAALLENLEGKIGRLTCGGCQGKHVLAPWCETNIVICGVNKGQSLNRFIHSRSVKEKLGTLNVGKNVMVAGDAANDLPMFVEWSEVENFHGETLAKTERPAIRIIMPDSEDDKLLEQSNLQNKVHEVLAAIPKKQETKTLTSLTEYVGCVASTGSTELEAACSALGPEHVNRLLRICGEAMKEDVEDKAVGVGSPLVSRTQVTSSFPAPAAADIVSPRLPRSSTASSREDGPLLTQSMRVVDEKLAVPEPPRQAEPIYSERLPHTSIDTIRRSLCADEDWPLQIYLERELGSHDIKATPWVEGERVTGTRVRRLQFRMPLPADVPKVVQRLIRLPEETAATLVARIGFSADLVVLLLEVVTHDVTYGNDFVVREILSFREHREGGSVFDKYVEVHWLNPLPFYAGVAGTFIEMKAKGDGKKSGAFLQRFLEQQPALPRK